MVVPYESYGMMQVNELFRDLWYIIFDFIYMSLIVIFRYHLSIERGQDGVEGNVNQKVTSHVWSNQFLWRVCLRAGVPTKVPSCTNILLQPITF